MTEAVEVDAEHVRLANPPNPRVRAILQVPRPVAVTVLSEEANLVPRGQLLATASREFLVAVGRCVTGKGTEALPVAWRFNADVCGVPIGRASVVPAAWISCSFVGPIGAATTVDGAYLFRWTISAVLDIATTVILPTAFIAKVGAAQGNASATEARGPITRCVGRAFHGLAEFQARIVVPLPTGHVEPGIQAVTLPPFAFVPAIPKAASRLPVAETVRPARLVGAELQAVVVVPIAAFHVALFVQANALAPETFVPTFVFATARHAVAGGVFRAWHGRSQLGAAITVEIGAFLEAVVVQAETRAPFAFVPAGSLATPQLGVAVRTIIAIDGRAVFEAEVIVEKPTFGVRVSIQAVAVAPFAFVETT